MITIPLPDKWVRKMVSEAIAAADPTIPVFDSRTNAEFPDNYVLMSTQNSIADPTTKCGERWNHTIQIDVYSRYPAVGNPGSRVAADDLAETVRAALVNISLDPASGLNLVRHDISVPFDAVFDDPDFIVTQKVFRLNCVIN